MINLISILALACSAFVPTVAEAPRNSYDNLVITPPSDLYVLDKSAIESNPNFVGYETVDPSSGEGILPWGYVYSACFVSVNWDGAPELVSLQFAKFNYSSGLFNSLPVTTPTFYASNSGAYPSICEYQYYDYTDTSVSYSQKEQVFGFDGVPYLRTYYYVSSNPSVKVDLTSKTLVNWFQGLVNAILINADQLGGAYFDKGFSEGKEQGYRSGYADGEQSVSQEMVVVSNLFGAVFGVPIGVLNGLSPFVMWSIPIISIAFTFLFFGLILWIVKKFI